MSRCMCNTCGLAGRTSALSMSPDLSVWCRGTELWFGCLPLSSPRRSSRLQRVRVQRAIDSHVHEHTARPPIDRLFIEGVFEERKVFDIHQLGRSVDPSCWLTHVNHKSCSLSRCATDCSFFLVFFWVFRRGLLIRTEVGLV